MAVRASLLFAFLAAPTLVFAQGPGSASPAGSMPPFGGPKPAVACAGDIKRYCSDAEAAKEGVRECVRANRLRLSQVCLRSIAEQRTLPRSTWR